MLDSAIKYIVTEFGRMAWRENGAGRPVYTENFIVRLTNSDRWFFIQVYRWFPSILQILSIIRPEALLRMAWPNILVMLAQTSTKLIETWWIATPRPEGRRVKEKNSWNRSHTTGHPRQRHRR